MGKRLQITPDNVRGGADRIGAENTTVTGIAVPDVTASMAGLTGFATAGTLTGAHDAVVSSLKVVGGRFEHMAELCRNCANTFEMSDLIAPGLLPKTWMSQQIGAGLAGMGDLNGATPGS